MPDVSEIQTYKIELVSSRFFCKGVKTYHHKVEKGYLIALKFITQKGGVWAHLSTKFG